MAEEEGKAIQWPAGADEATDFDFLMVGKDNEPIMKIPKEKLNEVIVINGEGVKAVAGGATSAAPTILRPGPNGQNRKMEDVIGWFVNGTSAEPPVATGIAWEAPAGKKNTNWWDGTAKVWSLGSSVALPAGPDINKVNDGSQELELYNQSYVKDGWTLNSAGVESESGNRQILSHLPCPENTTCDIDGFKQSISRTICYYNETGTFISSEVKAGLSFSIMTPTGTFSWSMIMRTDTTIQEDSKTTLSIKATLPVEYVNRIDGIGLQAARLESNNVVPNPVAPFNAANRNYVDTFSLLKSQIEIEGNPNLTAGADILNNRLIDVSGGLITATGWKTLKIPFNKPSTKFSFEGLKSVHPSFYLNYAGSNGVVLDVNSKVQFAPNGGLKTFTSIANNDLAYILLTVKAAADPNDDSWLTLVVNEGDKIVLQKIVSLMGIQLQGANGGSSDMVYDSLAVRALLLKDVPKSPVGLLPGSIWSNNGVMTIVEE